LTIFYKLDFNKIAALQLQKAILILLVTRQLSNAFAPHQVRGKSKTFFDGGYHPLDVTKRPEVIGKQESTYIKPVFTTLLLPRKLRQELRLFPKHLSKLKGSFLPT
jgi:hypothetical protein